MNGGISVKKILLLLITALVLLGVGYFAYLTYTFSQAIQDGSLDTSKYEDVESAELSSQLGTSATEQASREVRLAAINNYADDPALGPEDGEIVIVAFEDFQCPFCRRAYPIIKRVTEKYPFQVRFIYRDFPIASIHPRATQAAIAAQCAHEQGAFWPYHDLLFQNQQQLEDDDLRSYAAQIGINAASFDSCLSEQRYADEVAQDFQDGLTAGVTGTPTFFINGERIQGVVTEDAFDSIVEYIQSN